MMKRIFISGESAYPLYHPYRNVSSQLESIFAAYGSVYVSEHYESFEAQDYRRFDVAVLYTDHWIDKSGTSHAQVPALIDYIAGGGALFLLHNLDPGDDRELAQMIGARLRHPLQEQGGLQELLFVPEPLHPVSGGIAPFTLMEERFAMDYSPFTHRETFLWAQTPDGLRTPAGWSATFGLGRVIYLSPGHSADAFENPSCRQLIGQAAKWLLRE